VNAVARHAGNCDDMAMVLLDHRRQEFLNREEMADSVDIEDSADLFLCLAEERSADTYARIIDQDRGIPMLFADHFGHGTDLSRVADVGFVVVYVWSWVHIKKAILSEGGGTTYGIAVPEGRDRAQLQRQRSWLPLGK
jgi:hypothetical protein